MGKASQERLNKALLYHVGIHNVLSNFLLQLPVDHFGKSEWWRILFIWFENSYLLFLKKTTKPNQKTTSHCVLLEKICPLEKFVLPPPPKMEKNVFKCHWKYCVQRQNFFFKSLQNWLKREESLPVMLLTPELFCVWRDWSLIRYLSPVCYCCKHNITAWGKPSSLAPRNRGQSNRPSSAESSLTDKLTLINAYVKQINHIKLGSRNTETWFRSVEDVSERVCFL